MRRRRTLAACAALASVLGGLAAAAAGGVRWNGSASMPRGLWMLAPADSAIRRGEIVAACPPDTIAVREAALRGYIPAGRCPDGLEPLLKTAAAVAGDMVMVTRSGVTVNGVPVDDTMPLDRDGTGRRLQPFPAGAHSVPPGQIWLLSSHQPLGFDSRYFGPVPAANIRGVARPVWVSR
jgi:conjugative transfer signal peptidase TraF